MKKYVFTLLLLCFILLAGGCGSTGSSTSDSKSSRTASDTENSNYTARTKDNKSNAEKDKSDGNSNQGLDNTTEVENTSAAQKLNTEMLIYTCDILIDTLDYEKSVSTLKKLMSNAGGFIETETYSDGGSSDMYYIEDSQKSKQYVASIRIPHNKYDEFLNNAGELGDVRSKNSYVENVSQEYTDLNTTLNIYEAKEKRYIKLLSTITDESHAVSIEKELTEIQVKIAGIKTRMNEIHTDIDYSTINLTIREVTKYEEAPEKTDTFSQRLGKTLKNTWRYFLIFLETALFFFIGISPYAVILVIILVGCHAIQKKKKKKRKLQPTPQTPKSNSDMISLASTTVEKDTGASDGADSTENGEQK